MTEIRQEPERFEGRPLAVSAALVVLAILGSLAVVYALLQWGRDSISLRPGAPGWDREVPAEVSTLATQLYDRGHSQETPAELASRRARVRLDSYGWVDRTQRRVHIPVSVAIELYLEDGGAP